MQHFSMGSSTCKLRIGRKVRVSKVDVLILRMRRFVSRLAYYPIYLPNFSTPLYVYLQQKGIRGRMGSRVAWRWTLRPILLSRRCCQQVLISGTRSTCSCSTNVGHVYPLSLTFVSNILCLHSHWYFLVSLMIVEQSVGQGTYTLQSIEI